MRAKKVKWIKELVIGDDPSLLLTIRNYYGSKTDNFDDSKIYRTAKKLYSKSVPGIKNWGKVFKNIKPIQMKPEEVKNVSNNNSSVI